MISLGRIHDLLRLDAETGRLFWRITTNSHAVAGSEAGNTGSHGYRRVQIDGESIKSHRIVFAMTHGRWPTGAIDHINGMRADNRPSNLREASQAENNRNARVQSRNKSGAKGVSWRADRGKWWAQIVVDGEIKRLGYFNDLESASAAYQLAAKQYHGEFARVA